MNTRRKFLTTALAGTFGVIAGTALLSLYGCGGEGSEEEVAANEDLMREHGVLRRALLVDYLAAQKLRAVEDDAVKQIEVIEQSLKLADLAQLRHRLLR
jgi:hypothetical protein